MRSTKIWCRPILFFSLLFFGCSDNSEIDFRINEIVPSSDGPGAKVEIVGEGFGESASGVSVFFNETPAIIISFTDTLIVTKFLKKPQLEN